ncbi:hypothetical protein A7G45_15200 [Mycolicibacterium llatzerense]|nr:hypothetical protein [Mycolicibacterium llatzerense]
MPLADKDVIVLGFDGSTGRKRGKADATALIGCRVSDGYLFEIGERSVWEPPRSEMSTRDRAKTGDESYWQPPVAEVDATIRMAFKRYTVVGFYADPSGWTEQIAKWEAAFGAQLHPRVKASGQSKIAAWPRGKDTNAVEAVKALHTAIEHAECTHDGSTALTRHVLNARKRQVRAGYLLYKSYPDSPDKIDAAYAAVMAWKARLGAGAGAGGGGTGSAYEIALGRAMAAAAAPATAAVRDFGSRLRAVVRASGCRMGTKIQCYRRDASASCGYFSPGFVSSYAVSRQNTAISLGCWGIGVPRPGRGQTGRAVTPAESPRRAGGR